MEQLFLADMADMTDEEIREHIATQYSGAIYGEVAPAHPTADSIREALAQLDILIAQESVGSFGCNSSSWFLFRERMTGDLFESHGSHCSCYGFEGQFDLESTTEGALVGLASGGRRRARFVSCGWECEGEEADNDAIIAYVLRNFKSAPASS